MAKAKLSVATLRALKAHKTRKANNPNAGRLAALRAHVTRQSEALKRVRKPEEKREINAALAGLRKQIKSLERPTA